MNTESISYRSIVNRHIHDDRTLIFVRIAALHLGFSDSSSLVTAPSTHIHNTNALKWGFYYPHVLKMSKVSLQNVQDICQIETL